MPIIKENRYLGSMEMYFKPSDLFSFVEQGSQLSIFITKEFSGIIDSARFAKDNLQKRGSYLLLAGTVTTAPEYLQEKLLDNGREKISIHREGHYLVATFPIKNHKKETVAIFALSKNIESSLAEIRKTEWTLAALFLVSLGLVFAVIFFVVRVASGPLLTAKTTIQEMAKGEGDLRKRL